jgi:hypothetical protein
MTTLAEGNETVVVTLSAAAYYFGTPSSASLTIVDNNVVQFVWNSYDAVVSTTSSGAIIPDSSTVTIPMQVVVYRSSNNGL